MDILNTLFGKKKSGAGGRATMGRLYGEEHAHGTQERAITKEGVRGAPRSSRMQSVEFVLDRKHPPPLREFVKLVEEETVFPPVAAQPHTVVLLLDTKPSVAAEQVVKFVERQGVALPAPMQPPPVELVLDPSHPLALREVMKFAVVEATNTFSPAPQRRVQLVLDTKQKPRP
jgi:hypothetical protein